MTGPLDGLVVADFAQLAQGPFATQMLGDLGAEIIKIEPPKGDWMRHWSMANLLPWRRKRLLSQLQPQQAVHRDRSQASRRARTSRCG